MPRKKRDKPPREILTRPRRGQSNESINTGINASAAPYYQDRRASIASNASNASEINVLEVPLHDNTTTNNDDNNNNIISHSDQITPANNDLNDGTNDRSSLLMELTTMGNYNDTTVEYNIDNNVDNNDNVDNDDDDQDNQNRRRRRPNRATDELSASIATFHTNMTTDSAMNTNVTNVAHLTSANDEDEDFWGISSRWFSSDSPFYTYYAGFGGSGSGKGSGNEKGDGDGVVSDDTFLTHGKKRNKMEDFVDGSTTINNNDDGEYDNLAADEHDLFSEVSSMGDTPTIVVMSNKAKRKLKRICRTCYMTTLLSMGILVMIRGYNHEWLGNLGAQFSTSAPALFAPRRSKRYGPMMEVLVGVSGREVFEDVMSPQHSALVFLADQDPLFLVSSFFMYMFIFVTKI